MLMLLSVKSAFIISVISDSDNNCKQVKIRLLIRNEEKAIFVRTLSSVGRANDS
jgi:hypothetical protein